MNNSMMAQDIKRRLGEFPDVRLVSKSEHAPTRTIALVYFLFNLVGLVFPSIRSRFFGNFFTVIGNYILFPDTYDVDLNLPISNSEYFVLRHEIIHLRQKKKWGILFEISYLMFLPTLFTMRAYWEFEAYRESMQARYDVFGDISDNYIEFVVDRFSDPMYLFMFPIRPLVRLLLYRAAEDIRS